MGMVWITKIKTTMKQLLPMTINALSFFYDITLHWVTLKGRQGFLNSSALILPQYQILCAFKFIYTTPWPPLNNFQDPSFYLSSSPGMVRASWRWSQESMMISTKKSQGKLRDFSPWDVAKELEPKNNNRGRTGICYF